jgi:hypothetical protein
MSCDCLLITPRNDATSIAVSAFCPVHVVGYTRRMTLMDRTHRKRTIMNPDQSRSLFAPHLRKQSSKGKRRIERDLTIV